MVEEFAAAFGLSLPTASGQVVSYDFFRERLDYLTDDQTMFLDFTEALLVRFCRLWNPSINPESPGAKQIMEDPAFVTKSGVCNMFLSTSRRKCTWCQMPLTCGPSILPPFCG